MRAGGPGQGARLGGNSLGRGRGPLHSNGRPGLACSVTEPPRSPMGCSRGFQPSPHTQGSPQTSLLFLLWETPTSPSADPAPLWEEDPH